MDCGLTEPGCSTTSKGLSRDVVFMAVHQVIRGLCSREITEAVVNQRCITMPMYKCAAHLHRYLAIGLTVCGRMTAEAQGKAVLLSLTSRQRPLQILRPPTRCSLRPTDPAGGSVQPDLAPVPSGPGVRAERLQRRGREGVGHRDRQARLSQLAQLRHHRQRHQSLGRMTADEQGRAVLLSLGGCMPQRRHATCTLSDSRSDTRSLWRLHEEGGSAGNGSDSNGPARCTVKERQGEGLGQAAKGQGKAALLLTLLTTNCGRMDWTVMPSGAYSCFSDCAKKSTYALLAWSTPRM